MSYVQRTFSESGAILESEFLLDKIRRYHRRYSRAVTELDSFRETEFPERRIRFAPRSICLRSVCLKRNSISRFGRSDERCARLIAREHPLRNHQGFYTRSGTPCIYRRVIKNAAQCLAPRGIRAPFVKRVVRLINAALSLARELQLCSHTCVEKSTFHLPPRSINKAIHAAKYRPNTCAIRGRAGRLTLADVSTFRPACRCARL